MSIKHQLSEKNKRSLYGILDLLPDHIVINLQYYATLGRKLNLKKPVRFTEKIQWYKINYKNNLMTICADKFRMREYVSSKSYSSFLPELYFVCDTFEQIDFDKLPSSFAIKCNNGSGTNIFITDKNKMNIHEVKENVKSWEKVNTLSVGREWAYKNIPQKIIIEELLNPSDNFQMENGLNDYKLLCFNGVPKYAWVDVKRHSDHRRNFFDLEWNQLNVVTDKPLSDEVISKPEGFDTMVAIAEKIAQDFPFIRVDFYSVNGKVYIGELTFYPWSGCVQFVPDEFDFELGKLFRLPNGTEFKRGGLLNVKE